MLSRRMKLLMMFMFVATLGCLLFVVSQEVQQKQKALYRLEASIQQEKQKMRILNAEWAYLNNPERLEGLVQTYLGMGRVARVESSISNLPKAFIVSPPKSKPNISTKYFKRVSSNKDFSQLLGTLHPENE